MSIVLGFMFHQERCHDSGPNDILPNDNRSNDTGPMFELMFNKLASDIYIKKATNFNISQCEQGIKYTRAHIAHSAVPK